MVVLGLRQAQLAEDAVHVLLHRALGHPQQLRDAGVLTADEFDAKKAEILARL